MRAPPPPALVVLVVAGVLAAGAARAADPCSDEPGFAVLACRAAGLADAAAGVEKKGVGRRIARQAGRIERLVARAAEECTGGRSARAVRRLRPLGTRLGRLGRTFRRAGRRGDVTAAQATTFAGDVALTDALHRATAARLDRHPCPELVEVLRPEWNEARADGELFVLLRLAAGADPATLAVEVVTEAGTVPVPLDPANVSTTGAWARLACPAAGALRLRVSVQGGGITDSEEVPVFCGAGRVLGAEVEALLFEDHSAAALRLFPVRPLRPGATYALVATRGLRTRGGRRFGPSAAFRAAAGTGGRARGPQAFYGADAGDFRNPFPSERLVRADGTVVVPDGFAARGLPRAARLDGVRAFLGVLAAGTEEHHGFSPNTAPVLHFTAGVDVDRATPDDVFLIEVATPGPPGTNLGAVLDALERERGLGRRDVAVASVFPVEDVPAALLAIREQLLARAAASPLVADFTDPDPTDTRRFGVFRPGDPGFADFFDGAPPATVGAVARGRFPSPDYRENGRFPARFLDGSETPPSPPLEFLLAVPAGTPPFPTVVVQHGFAGDDDIVTDLAGVLTAAGLAAIGVPAPEHGPRGQFLDFFDFDDFNAFGNNWRQASVDLLSLVRLVEAGVDLEGDGTSELRPTDLGYLGVSLGGVIGGVFAAVEPRVTAAVLNVAGARISQLAGATSPFAEPFLARFAELSAIPVKVCGADPVGRTCTADDECPGRAACERNPDFTLLLEAAAADWQAQLDPGDGAAYARLFRIEPPGGVPKAVLVQEGIGDMILANPLTEALARTIGLEANRPAVAASGVAGLWRYPPPDGHGILDLPAVRAQAAGFLASGGTDLAAP